MTNTIEIEIDMKLFGKLLKEAVLINDFGTPEHQRYKFKKAHSCTFEFFKISDDAYGLVYGVRLMFENKKDAMMFQLRYS